MTDYGTIKIPQPAYEHHNERRQDLGLTWEQYINGQEPDAPAPDMGGVESSLQAIEERLNTVEQTLEDVHDRVNQ